MSCQKLSLIILLIFLITGCSLFQTKPIEVCKVEKPFIFDKPEPIVVSKLNIRYDKSTELYFLDKNSFISLNIFLIDVEKYVSETNTILEIMEKPNE